MIRLIRGIDRRNFFPGAKSGNRDDEYGDGSRSGRSSRDQSGLLERQDHLVHRRRRDAKEARDVGLRRRAPIYGRIGVGEGEILTPVSR